MTAWWDARAMGSNARSVVFGIRAHLRRRALAVLVRRMPVTATRLLYWSRTGRRLRLRRPVTFNEKIQWLKLYWRDPRVVRCADKYEVRNYVTEAGCGDLLNELYAVCEDPATLDWERLPGRFVLKATNACGRILVSHRKADLDPAVVRRTMADWLRQDYALFSAEIHYSRMTPRIVCEKNLQADAGRAIADYKIYCFEGRPHMVLACVGRESRPEWHFLDLSWQPLPAAQTPPLGPSPDRPRSLPRMLEAAAALARPFPFVRVDFYDADGQAVFGELTFTPAAGMWKGYTDTYARMLGDLIVLPPKQDPCFW